jgi:hypothetical protein
MRSLRKMVATIVLGVACAAACAASQSEMFQISATTNGDPVDATALFGINSSGYLTLTLSNLESSIVDVGQAVTGIEFNLSVSDSGITSHSQPTSSGDVVQVGSGGSVTDNGIGSLAAYWTASTSLHEVLLNVFGGQPNGSILGPETGQSYPDANGSIAGNGPHNPFVDGTATFTFADLGNFSSYNLASIVSAVEIEFGTTGTDYLSTGQVPVATPEPGSILLAVTGLALMGARLRRNWSR